MTPLSVHLFDKALAAALERKKEKQTKAAKKLELAQAQQQQRDGR